MFKDTGGTLRGDLKHVRPIRQALSSRLTTGLMSMVWVEENSSPRGEDSTGVGNCRDCLLLLWMQMEGCTSKKASVDKAPRVPPLKLSINRTHRFSSGTAVPPEVTHTIGLPNESAVAYDCAQMTANSDRLDTDSALHDVFGRSS